MAQISRPLQVVLAAAGLLVVVWFVALRGHSSSSEPGATPSASSSQPSQASSSPGSPSSVYHGSAPGVEGLTRDIQKAHGAVATSERNAAQLEQKSAQASRESAARTPSAARSRATASASKASARTKSASPPHRKASVQHVSNGTAGQVWVEHQLARNTTVALLFYSPHSYDDSRTRRELQRLIGQERSHRVKIALRVVPADEVGVFGAFTRVASVYQTPTLLLVTPSGEVKPPITGLADAFSIEQAIDEKTQP
jgi:hypothetical protein